MLTVTRKQLRRRAEPVIVVDLAVGGSLVDAGERQPFELLVLLGPIVRARTIENPLRTIISSGTWKTKVEA